ncbi:pre-60S ribosomal particles component [Zygosaccharomyces mellis]|uniref:Pre-60S ribosomal particles component n=1 Tax=Zygosaccharomyces mellis TaxID=42258 RepID=A0A4C2E390_9SACH|nr:pre-60S ribosomal particles component [Zygosaccharomyces mellis]
MVSKRSRSVRFAESENPEKQTAGKQVESESSSDNGGNSEDIGEASADEASGSDNAEIEEPSSADDEEEENDDGEEDFPRRKKSKVSKHDDGSAGFSNAMNAILSSHLKAYDRDDPIMARNKKILKKNETDKLERQAKKALLVEKKKKLNKVRRKDVIPKVTDESGDKTGEEIRIVLEKEAKLKKIARKGAVKLFNAILSTQVNTERDSKTVTGVGQQEKKQRLVDLSKEKFLDMVKAAGDNE